MIQVLGSCAFDFLGVVAGGVGQRYRSIRLLLEVLKRNFRKVERDLFHRQDAAAVGAACIERRNYEVAERHFRIRERVAVAARLATCKDRLWDVVALGAGEEQLGGRLPF